MIKIEDHKINEANLQAEIYRRLVNAGYTCELEVQLKDKIKRGTYKYAKYATTRAKCIIDIAVIYDGYYILLIEVKNDDTSGYWVYSDEETTTKQLNRYLQYGLPLYRIGSFKNLDNDIITIINKINSLI